MDRRTATPALAALLVVSAGLPLRADPGSEEARDRALCRRVTDSPCSLAQGVEQATRSAKRVALAAGFALRADGRLELTVVTVGAGEDAIDFEEATGSVLEEGWAPTRRPLTEAGAIAEAARAQAVLAQTDLDLARALEPLVTPVFLRPRVLGRTPGFEGCTVRDGLPWATRQDLASGAVTSAEPPPYERERREAARRRVGKPLPELDARGGRWLNVAEPLTLAARRGRPTLVVVTNLACERECGPAPAVLARWRTRYGPAGLEVVTLYREAGFGSAAPTLDETASAVRERGVLHPVLLDPEDHLLRALEPGPLGYPVAFLVGRDGLVAWEGSTSLLGFEERCESALRDAIR